MHYLNCDVITCCEAVIWIKLTHLKISRMEIGKQRENMKTKDILHKSASKRSFRHRSQFAEASCMPEKALTSLTVSDAYR